MLAYSVMPGHSRLKDGVASARLCPGIHVLRSALKTWMAGTFCVKTRFALKPGHDALCNKLREKITSTAIEVSTLLTASCQLIEHDLFGKPLRTFPDHASERVRELAHGRFEGCLAAGGKGGEREHGETEQHRREGHHSHGRPAVIGEQLAGRERADRHHPEHQKIVERLHLVALLRPVRLQHQCGGPDEGKIPA